MIICKLFANLLKYTFI